MYLFRKGEGDGVDYHLSPSKDQWKYAGKQVSRAEEARKS
jgi:hypothetical protein